MPDNQGEKTQKDKSEIEQKCFEITKDEDLGLVGDIFSAKTDIEGQDGGVVSTLLVKGFEEGLFDVAIVVRRGDGYCAEAVIAEKPSDVLAAKGTKYLKVNVTKKLRELISQGKKRIAVVCTPCEANAARKIQQTLKHDCEITIIGLFCFEAFNCAKIKEEVKSQLGVDLDKAQKTQVKYGKFTAVVDGKEYSCKVNDLDAAAEKVCRYCGDFTAQLADVSVGSVGSKKGYSTVIVRSKAGEKLIKNLDAAKEMVDREEIVRLSKFKRERAKKSLAVLKEAK
jgi:coenzyme F420 hydrogenase subunit beta